MSFRTIRLAFDRAALTTLSNATSSEGVADAVFYLNTWALDSYDYVTISIDVGSAISAPGLTGVFRKDGPEGPVSYVIGAVWDAQREAFGFHS